VVKKIILTLLAILILINIVSAVRYELSSERLVFNTKNPNEKLIVLQTDTEPLLISVKVSSSLKNILEISPNKDLRVTKDKPLVLKIKSKSPKPIKGIITINSLYEKLPKNINYYGDDTITIPILIDNTLSSTNKLYIELTEKKLPGESETVALGINIFLPVILFLIGLLVMKAKWQKKASGKK